MEAEITGALQNTIKAQMARGEVVASLTVRLVHSPDIAYLAKTAGFDALYVDMKHCSISMRDAGEICMAALSVGITPLVRLASNSPDEISRVLDAGALGVIAPQVRSADEVREIVKAAKYPPLGERSVSGSQPALQYLPLGHAEIIRLMNDATIVAINVETKEALESIEEIAAVEGLDLLTVGTNDLTTEYGVPAEHGHQLVRDAYARVIAACSDRGNHVGIGGLSNRPDLVEEFVKMGARYVSTGYDLMFLLAEMKVRAARVKSIEL